MVVGIAFDVKHFAVHDGPGIRTTVFLKGCPLTCMWCHSPESQSTKVEISFYKDLCIGCGACVEVCPTGAQTIGPEKIRRELCVRCGRCADACYAGALVKIGDYVSIDDILREVEKDRLLYKTSGGGVTLSGGEPTQQPEFTYELLRAMKEQSYHTALDTCGYVQWETFENILRYTDLVMYDVKHMDPEKHRHYTKKPNELILRNLKKISEMRKRIWIRVPLIPGVNDSDEHIRQLCEFLVTINFESVQFLPYHTLGVAKYDALNREYRLSDLRLHDKRRLLEIKNLASIYYMNVIVKGVD